VLKLVVCLRLAIFAIAADGSILRSIIGRRSWRQRRAVARFMRAEFRGHLPQERRRQDAHVERLRVDFEFLGLLVSGAVEHSRGDTNRQGLMLRVSLVGFQHTLEDIDRGVLERLEPLGRFHLHVRRRATVKTADSASWNRRIPTPFSGLAGVGRAPSWVSRVLATLERGHR
jgi:hypothetical protein